MNKSNHLEAVKVTLERLIRWAGLAGLVASALIITSQFVGLFLLISNLPLNESVMVAPVIPYNILKLSGIVLLLLGLVGLYARQSFAGGTRVDRFYGRLSGHSACNG